MNQTFASVRRGQNYATFPISLPRNVGISDVNQEYLGIPRHIGYWGKIPNINYALDYTISHERKTASFSILTGPLQKTTGHDVAEKLKTHFNEMSKQFPTLASKKLPFILYNTETAGQEKFEIDLPPRTSVYSSSEYLFPSLGFAGHPNLLSKTKDIGPKGGTPARAKVWGFFNNSDVKSEYYEGVKTMPAKMTMAERVDVDAEAFPKSMTLQAEVGDVGFVRVLLLGNRGMDRPVTKEEVVLQLTAHLEMARRKAGLKENPFEIVPGDDNKILLTNKAFPGSGVSMSLAFTEEMGRALNLTPRQYLQFDLNVVRGYTLKVQDVMREPFVGRFPVQMRMCGFGRASSVREGKGTIPIFAFLNDKSDKHPIISQGAVFNTDRTMLQIEFTDCAGEMIVFEQDFQISMLLTFKKI